VRSDPSPDLSTLDEWVIHGAPATGTLHLRLHVEMERNARRMLTIAMVLILVTLVNLAMTVLSVWLRFGAATQ